MLGIPSERGSSVCIVVMNGPSTNCLIGSASPVTKRQRSGSALYFWANAESRAGVSYVGSIDIDISLMRWPASNVFSWIFDIFIDVIGQTVTQRVKMKLTIVG